MQQRDFGYKGKNNPTERSKIHEDKIRQFLSMLVPPTIIRTEKLVNLLKEPINAVLDGNESFIVDRTATGKNIPVYLYKLQQPTKKNK